MPSKRYTRTKTSACITCQAALLLAALAEKVRAESELGFRRGRGCSDGIFFLRRLVEEWSHSAPLQHEPTESNLFILFLDLSKAFDGVPWTSLFALLSTKLGVPAKIVTMHAGLWPCWTSECSHTDEHRCPPGQRGGAIAFLALLHLRCPSLASEMRDA